MAKPVIRWAIIGSCGLYTGQWFRRIDAIAQHASMKQRIGEPGLSRFPCGPRGLDDRQQAGWKRCRKNGDRAVKIKITIIGTRP